MGGWWLGGVLRRENVLVSICGRTSVATSLPQFDCKSGFNVVYTKYSSQTADVINDLPIRLWLYVNC